MYFASQIVAVKIIVIRLVIVEIMTLAARTRTQLRSSEEESWCTTNIAISDLIVFQWRDDSSALPSLTVSVSQKDRYFLIGLTANLIKVLSLY